MNAHKCYVTEIKGKAGIVTFYMEPYAPVIVENIPKLMQKYQKVLEFDPKGTPCFILRYKKNGLVEKEAELMIKYTNLILKDMQILYSSQEPMQAGDRQWWWNLSTISQQIPL